MATLTRPVEPRNLPEVEYSEEDVARFKRIADIMRAKRATGEYRVRSLSEFAAEYGVKI